MRFKTLPLLLAAAAFTQATAATFTWQTTGASSDWNPTDANWYVDAGTTLTPWTDGNDAVFSGTGGTVTINQLITPGNVTFGGGDWTLDGTNNDDFSLGGTGTLTVNSGNVNLLYAYNTYTGGTIVNGGTLTLGEGGGYGLIIGTVTVNAGGILAFTGYDAMGYADGNKVDTVYLNGGLITSSVGNAGWGVDYYLTGGTMRTTGGTFSFGGNSADKNTSVTTLASSVSSVIAGSVTLRTDSGNNVNFTIADGAADADLVVTAGITDNGGGGGITKLGAGKMMLSGINTYLGATNVNAGTLVIGGSGTLESSPVSVATGAVFQVDSTGKTLASITVADGGTLKIAADKVSTTTVTGALTFTSGTITITPIIAGAVGAGDVLNLITAGSISNGATLVAGVIDNSRVQGTISVSGNILQYTVTSGAASLVWNNGIGTGVWDLNTTANFNNGGSNDRFYNADSVTFDDSVGAGAKIVTLSGSLSPGLVTVNNTAAGGSYTFAGGGIAGGAAIAKTGDGTLVITNENTNSGTITITTGVLQVGNGGTAGSLGTGGVANNASLAFNRSDNTVFSNLISGTGTLAQNGTGTITLSAANTYTGLTTVNSGTLEVTNSSGGKIYSVASAGTLKLSYSVGQGYGTGVTVNGAGVDALTGLYLAGGTNISMSEGVTLQGAASTVRTYGTGTAILQGWDTNKTYLTVADSASGSVIDTGVRLRTGTYGYTMNIAAGANTATGDITIKGVLDSFGYDGSVYVKNGAGSVRLTGTNTFSSNFNINAGTVITGNIAALGTGSINVGAGGVLKIGDGVVNGVTLGDAAALVVAGTLKVGSTASLLTVGASGSYNLSGATLDLNGLFDGVTGTHQYTLITGGVGNTENLSTITGFNSSLVSVLFDAGVLTVTAIPEPSTYGLVGAAAFLSVATVSRRRRMKA